ncbi:MAG: SUMF1/EgtB/PvdO family nonheme iron enzyme, partial [Pedosphaera parvula]|nr:SUMF1/EgtB/PvdO family nonheme iron enzyme [Pedosphaera parvula]
DATNYCARLTDQERVAGRLPDGWEYRLPTEAEWEYGCRAGTTSRLYYGDDPNYSELDNYAWYNKNSGDTSHVVGGKKPNAWGLHDMLGNVYEWCQDWYGPYPGGSVADPQGPAAGSDRVDRGGSYNYDNYLCRSADRRYIPPATKGSYIGFRLVLVEAP